MGHLETVWNVVVQNGKFWNIMELYGIFRNSMAHFPALFMTTLS